MFIFANFFLVLAKAADIIITVYTWLVIIRVVISWVNVDPYNPFVQFLVKVTEPVLGRIRRIVPDLGGLDISPIILIFGLYLLESVIVGTLRDLAFALR